MSYHDVYAVTTLETASLGTPNKVAVLVTDVPAKHAPIVCPLWKSDISHFAVLSFKQLLNTICNALAVALHSVNKQNNNEILTTNILLVQPTQKLYSYIV
jgi:hypothetical protein